MKEYEIIYCNFCGRSEKGIKFSVAGPLDEEHICNNCIEACMELWKDFQVEEKQKDDYITKQRLIESLEE